MEGFRTSNKNETMRTLVILIILMYSCSASRIEQEGNVKEYCIEAIDSTTYDTCYIIDIEEDRSGEKFKLLSRKEFYQICDTPIRVGNCYEISITGLSSTSGFMDIGYRLGKYDIYENGKLVFTISDHVVMSNEIRDLCFMPLSGK